MARARGLILVCCLQSEDCITFAPEAKPMRKPGSITTSEAAAWLSLDTTDSDNLVLQILKIV